jgi:hypothetical protein
MSEVPSQSGPSLSTLSGQGSADGVAGGHCTVVRTESLRAQSARHRADLPTISGRSCANSAHYKPLFACVDRTFVKSISSRRRPEKKERIAGEG